MKVLNWLSPLDPEDDQREAHGLLSEDTGNWIFEDAEYISWLSTRGSFLWLHGQSNPPGQYCLTWIKWVLERQSLRIILTCRINGAVPRLLRMSLVIVTSNLLELRFSIAMETSLKSKIFGIYLAAY